MNVMRYFYSLMSVKRAWDPPLPPLIRTTKIIVSNVKCKLFHLLSEHIRIMVNRAKLPSVSTV